MSTWPGLSAHCRGLRLSLRDDTFKQEEFASTGAYSRCHAVGKLLLCCCKCPVCEQSITSIRKLPLAGCIQLPQVFALRQRGRLLLTCRNPWYYSKASGTWSGPQGLHITAISCLHMSWQAKTAAGPTAAHKHQYLVRPWFSIHMLCRRAPWSHKLHPEPSLIAIVDSGDSLA